MTPVRIPLPDLHYYEGPARLIPAIVSGSLSKVRLEWFFEDIADVDDITTALSSSVIADQFLFLNEYIHFEWCGIIVDSVSRNMPHVRMLALRSSSKYVTSDDVSLGVFSLIKLTRNADDDTPSYDIPFALHVSQIPRNRILTRV